MFRRTVLVWLVMASVETAQGLIRRLVLAPLTGEVAADLAGLAVGIVLVLLIAWWSAGYVGAAQPADRLKVGGVWVLLTLAYEIFIGRLLGLSWVQIARDYRLDQGGLLPIGLFAMLFAPMIVDALRSLRVAGRSSGAGRSSDDRALYGQQGQ